MLKLPSVGILSPGDMGHAFGKSLINNGFQVFTCLLGRSLRTKKLSSFAEIINIEDFPRFLNKIDIILSIIPPENAINQATFINNFCDKIEKKILYVDCNAIAPSTSKKIELILSKKYFYYVDGGIIGLNPIIEKGKTRLYVSGKKAYKCEVFNNNGIIVKNISNKIGDASAIKMIYASATKGTFSLHAAVLTVAMKLNLFDEYLEELTFSRPDILSAMEKMVPKIPLDASRWEGEMIEIANTFSSKKITPKFHEAAAEIMKIAKLTPIAKETRENYDNSRHLKKVVEMFSKASNKNRQ